MLVDEDGLQMIVLAEPVGCRRAHYSGPYDTNIGFRPRRERSGYLSRFTKFQSPWEKSRLSVRQSNRRKKRAPTDGRYRPGKRPCQSYAVTKAGYSDEGFCDIRSPWQGVGVEKNLSFWLSSLTLPEDVLEHLWKASGHLVPSELEGLISILRSQGAIVAGKHESLKHAYESYLGFCTSLGLDPGDVQSSVEKFEVLNARNLVGTMEPNGTVDILKGIPVTFGEIDRLRDLGRTLKDLDGLVNLLSRIRERFLGVEMDKDDSLRLYIASSGKGINFRLVYEPFSTARLKHSHELTLGKNVRIQPAFTSNLDEQRWVGYGQRALLEKGTKTNAKA